MSRNCFADRQTGRQTDRQTGRQTGRPNRPNSEARPGQKVAGTVVAENYVPRARRRARRYETTFVRD